MGVHFEDPDQEKDEPSADDEIDPIERRFLEGQERRRKQREEQSKPRARPEPAPEVQMGRFRRKPPDWWEGEEQAYAEAQGVSSFFKGR